MTTERYLPGCRGLFDFHRRTMLKTAGSVTGLAWMTAVAEALARDAEQAARGKPARSVIVLWMAGGPSQLETFDPKPDAKIGGGTKARRTRVKGIEIAEPYEQVADVMHHISLVRSVTSKEGDHERATYAAKSGYRPDPTLVHPSIGAILCHQSQDNVEIPRHVSILPGPWPARGGYLGAQFDAFKVYDPKGPIPDVRSSVDDVRMEKRIKDLSIVEREFARGRLGQLDTYKTLHRATTDAALKMMSSEQLKAFDVNLAPQEVLASFGDSAFGRGCLAAARLIEVGVRCIEVTLDGWDSHINNHETHASRAKELDPAFAALLRYLDERDLLNSTLVLWGGEFGRTPNVNPAGGRDHWPHGFTVAFAGGGVAPGRVIGETSPAPPEKADDWTSHLKDPHSIGDIHATVLHSLGIDYEKEIITPIGRPMRLSEGKPIGELLPT